MHGRNRAEYKAKTRNEQVAAALSKKALHWNTLSNQILLQHKRNKGGSSLQSLSAATGKHNASINVNVHLPSLTQPGESMSMSTAIEEVNDGISQHMDGAIVMALTEKLLLVNPDPSYLWNVRRHVLLMGRHMAGGANFEVSQELQLSAAALERNPKAYGAWLHRKWSVRHHLMVVVPSTLLTTPNDTTSDNNQNNAATMWATLLPNELELCGKLLSMDERNFHCWNYRRFIVSALGYLIMKRHTHSSLFLQQATREDCSDFYFVRNCADHPYATKFAMDGSWKMWTDYIEHNHEEHNFLQQQEKARLLQEMAAASAEAEAPPGESDPNANINVEVNLSSMSASNKPKKVGHRKQGSAGSFTYLHGGKEDRSKRTSTSLMGPQLTSLNYTNLEENLHAAYDAEIPATVSNGDGESEDLLTPPRIALLHLLQTEWDFTSQKMQDNFSNCSAFHYRSKLLPLYAKYCYKRSEENQNNIQEKEDTSTSSGVAAVVARLEDFQTTMLPLAMEELNLVRQAIYTEPDDQTPWWYHRFLLEWIKPPSLASLLRSSTTSSRPASTNSQKQRSLSPEDEQEIRSAHQVCVSAYMKTVLQEDVEALEELLEAEDGQLKWAWMALHNLFGLLLDHGREGADSEGDDYKVKQRECITNLMELDPDRRGRYLDMLHDQQAEGDNESNIVP